GIVVGGGLAGSLPLRPLPTTSFGCGICCPRQCLPHNSGEKCVRTPAQPTFGHRGCSKPHTKSCSQSKHDELSLGSTPKHVLFQNPARMSCGDVRSFRRQEFP